MCRVLSTRKSFQTSHRQCMCRFRVGLRLNTCQVLMDPALWISVAVVERPCQILPQDRTARELHYRICLLTGMLDVNLAICCLWRFTAALHCRSSGLYFLCFVRYRTRGHVSPSSTSCRQSSTDYCGTSQRQFTLSTTPAHIAPHYTHVLAWSRVLADVYHISTFCKIFSVMLTVQPSLFFMSRCCNCC